MASYARCFFFLLLALSLCFHSHARDSKFFSKATKEKKESISISPAQAPTLAPSPSPEPEVVEHGYGLYGQEPYDNYQYPPTTTNPTKTETFGEDKFVPAEELSKNNFDEFRMGYSNNNFNGNGKGNGYVREKQGMSDTRFMENGKYFYDLDQEAKDDSSYLNGNGHRSGYLSEKQGMSDTRFLENGKYYYDVNDEGKNSHFTTNYENQNENENQKFEAVEEKFDHFNTNYENEDKNENKHERFETEKQGMSDTRFLENGKYFYDAKNDDGVGDVGFHNNNNVEYANAYHGNGNNEYETEGRGGYNYKGKEYGVKQGSGGYNGGSPKKFPNEYDTMEEYDREQGYIDGHEDEYVP